MTDWVVEAFNEEIRLKMLELAVKELEKLSKKDLIDFIINNMDLIRPDPQPPSGRVEFTEGDLTPRMSRELDELQQKWAMLNPKIRSAIDRRMREMIKEGKVTKKTPRR